MSLHDNSSPVTITLTDGEVDVIRAHGQHRTDIRDYADNYNIKEEKTHIRGLKGEFAFADYYGLPVDLTTRVNGDKEDFVAIIGGEEKTIDVKTTQYFTDPWLKVRPSYANKADIYVLAAVNSHTVKLVGYATQEQVKNTDVTFETGHRNNHVLKPSDIKTLPSPTEISPTDESHQTSITQVTTGDSSSVRARGQHTNPEIDLPDHKKITALEDYASDDIQSKQEEGNEIEVDSDMSSQDVQIKE